MRIFGAILFTIVYGFLGFFAIVVSIIMSSQNGYMYVIMVVAAIGIWSYLAIFGLLSKLATRTNVLILVALFVIPNASYGSYEWYMNTIEIKQAEVDLTRYEPFTEGTKVAQLKEPSSFTIDEDAPTIDGATALYPVYAAFTRAVYPEGKEYGHDQFGESPVVVSKTTGAYERLAKDEVDLIFAAGPSEQQQRDLGETMELTPIGKEAFVFFVHKSNPIDSLTIDQLQDIYSGQATNWKDVGGKDKEIIAFQRPEGSGSQTGLQNMMGDNPIMEPPMDRRVSGMGGVIEKASNYRNHRNAMGFSYRYFATQMVEDHSIKLLKINGVEPTVRQISSGNYPLTGSFYAITNGTDHPMVDPFIQWILSEQGQSLIEKTGYVPIQDF